jgi:hypothetical protein
MKYAEGKRRQDEMRRRVELLSPGGLRGRPMLQYVEQMARVHPVWQYGALSISASKAVPSGCTCASRSPIGCPRTTT